MLKNGTLWIFFSSYYFTYLRHLNKLLFEYTCIDAKIKNIDKTLNQKHLLLFLVTNLDYYLPIIPQFAGY